MGKRRIKPVVNLQPKRKVDTVKSPVKINSSDSLKTCIEDANSIQTSSSAENISDHSIFKKPLESNETQQQQQQLSSSQLLKHRQRIKPVPCFGLTRRNSINDVEEEHHHHRRQRHLSEQGGTSSTTTSETTDNLSGTTNPNNVNRNQVSYRCRKMSSSEDTQQKSSTTVVKRTFVKYNLKAVEKFEKSSMKMLDFIYYNPSTNPMNAVESEKSSASVVDDESNEVTKEDTINDSALDNNTPGPAVPVPQLKLGPNGEVILDEKSLVIETTAEKEGRKNLLKSEILYLDDNTGSNGFYKRQKRTKDWTYEETIKFYRCLHTVGTDFSLMLTLFPNRTRRELKLKFKKEEKVNLALVNKALLYPKAFNVDELRKELEKDENEKKSKLERVKIIKKCTKKPFNYGSMSKAARTLVGGDIAYETDVISSSSTNRTNHKTRKYTKKNFITNDKQTEKESYVKCDKSPNEIDDIDEQMIFEELINDDNSDNEEKINKEHLNTKNNRQKELSSQAFCSNDNFEDDINNLLSELENGSLVLVSSEDPNNPGKIINEIRIMCKETNQLSENSLDLPEDVINYISEAFE